MTDRDFITKDNLSLYCNTNGHLLTGPVRGAALEFPGLDGGSCLGGRMTRGPYEDGYAQALAREGVLLAYTFPGPWSWMSRGAVRLIDLLADALLEKYGLPADFPLVVTGGSMGGLGALIYSAQTRHKIAGCAAACPCYDVPAAVFVHPDFPRTYLHAVADYDMPFEDALKTISPVHNLDSLPDVPYFVTCDGADALFPEAGMDDFIAAMRARGLTVDYRKMPGKAHGEFTPEVRNALTGFVIRCAAR